MGSAFTPVQPRGSDAGAGRSRTGKRTRQASSSLHQMGGTTTLGHGGSHHRLDKVDEEYIDHPDHHTLETVPDNLSTSASEAESSKGSNNSQPPPLLDFITNGGACMASAWFTSCFPCAVVDINDRDDYVVDKLSRESAMNVMYATQVVTTPTHSPNSPDRRLGDLSSFPPPQQQQEEGEKRRVIIQPNGSDQEKNMMFVRLPERERSMDGGGGGGGGGPPIHSVPSIIQEDEEEEDEAMDDISLDDDDDIDAAGLPVLVPVVQESFDSGIVDYSYHGGGSTSTASIGGRSSSGMRSPPRKKFSIKKMFSKKKKKT